MQCILDDAHVSTKAGTIGEHGVILPPALPLTSERLERHGLFLIEDGQTIFLWVGRDAVPQLIQDVFDLPSYDVLRGGKVCVMKCIVLVFFIDLFEFYRQPFGLWITHSLNVSTLWFRRSGRCVGAFITLIFIL